MSAPAGFGKTTALAEWLSSAPDHRLHTAWLSLDAGDNHPASFWAHVIAALQGVAPGIGDEVLGVLDSGEPSIETVVAPLLNELSVVPDDIVLVLDDYHVIDASQVLGEIEFLVDHLPANVHLVIATRADPALPLARLRVRGDLVEVRAADLRFSPGEAAAYLTDVIGLTLTAPDIAALEARTEGWIAAIQLAGLSMQGRDDVAGFIAGFAGDDRYVVDYLMEEVLRRQPRAGPELPARNLDPGPHDRPAVRRGDRPATGQSHARGARPRQPLPRPARRPAAVVPLPPPVRRRPAGAAPGRAVRPSCPTCIDERATGTNGTATAPRPSATRWPAATSLERPT